MTDGPDPKVYRIGASPTNNRLCLPMFGQGYSEIVHGTRKQSTGRITRDSGKRQWGAGSRPEISPHQFAEIGPHGMNASS